MTETDQRKAGIVGVFDRSAESYDQVGVDFFTPIGRRLAEHAAVRPGERLLDLGCGRGAALLPAARAVGPTGTATGIDLAPTMVRLTGAAAAAQGLSWVDVRVGDAEAPDLPDASVDLVLASLVIFMLPDPVRALASYMRLLRPGGRLAFSTFSTYDERYETALKVLRGYLPEDTPAPRIPEDSPFRDAESIGALLAGAGFTDVLHTEATFHSRFRDFAHWTDWTWSHGGRATLEKIPEQRLPEALAATEAALADGYQAGGGFTITTGVRFTRARLVSGAGH
ncbi:MAG: class I SAM-dependent methyltransferase [Micromonosporaceae bacterium]